MEFGGLVSGPRLRVPFGAARPLLRRHPAIFKVGRVLGQNAVYPTTKGIRFFVARAASGAAESRGLCRCQNRQGCRTYRALERRAYRLGNLPDEIADAIERATMDSAHDQLNELPQDQS